MDVSLFIARRLKFKGRIAMVSIAISFFVMILSVSISSGFRNEIRDGISSISGDIQITPVNLNYFDESSPIEKDPSYLSELESIPGVEDVSPAVYRAGIVKKDDHIQGVIFKGVEKSENDSISRMSVSIPSSLASLLGINEGDELQSYFVGEKVKVRKFKVSSIYEGMLDTKDNLVVYASMGDIQRINGWNAGQVSVLEVMLADDLKSVSDIKEITTEVGNTIMLFSSDEEASVVATSVVSRYPQIFDWLDLIDFNVAFILLLMTIVAGFNMISGLLIMLFENIPTIGLLKSLGMDDRGIAKIFLASSSVAVLKGMLYGNALALAFCLLQDKFHFIGLDASNYFVPFVPVHIDFPLIIISDAAVYLAIMLLLLLPSAFISKVDPSRTVRMS